MATRKSTEPKSSLESVNEIYAARLGSLEAAEEAKETEASEEAKATEEVHTELPEEAKFVGNPDDLRKEVDSEEKFSEETADEDEAKA